MNINPLSPESFSAFNLTLSPLVSIERYGLLVLPSGVNCVVPSELTRSLSSPPVSMVNVSAAGNPNEVLVSPIWKIDSAMPTVLVNVPSPETSKVLSRSVAPVTVNAPPTVAPTPRTNWERLLSAKRKLLVSLRVSPAPTMATLFGVNDWNVARPLILRFLPVISS